MHLMISLNTPPCKHIKFQTEKYAGSTTGEVVSLIAKQNGQHQVLQEKRHVRVESYKRQTREDLTSPLQLLHHFIIDEIGR